MCVCDAVLFIIDLYVLVFVEYIITHVILLLRLIWMLVSFLKIQVQPRGVFHAREVIINQTVLTNIKCQKVFFGADSTKFWLLIAFSFYCGWSCITKTLQINQHFVNTKTHINYNSYSHTRLIFLLVHKKFCPAKKNLWCLPKN